MLGDYSTRMLLLLKLVFLLIAISNAAPNSRFINPYEEPTLEERDGDWSSVFKGNFAFNDVFTSFLKAAGPVLFICLQLSCVHTVLGIRKMKAVHKLSCFPFVSLLVCGAFWVLYGYFTNDMTVFFPNFSAILAASFCMWNYYLYAVVKPNKMFLAAALLILFALVLAYMRDYHMIGLVGCVLSVMVSGSPLAVVRTVITERSTAALPFMTSLITWMNAMCWVGYGYLIANDVLIYGPNLLGLGLATLQMSLFAVYGFPPAAAKDSLGLLPRHSA